MSADETDLAGHVLVIRAWHDGDHAAVRARLLSALGADEEPATVAVAEGPDGICELVRRWLLGLSTEELSAEELR